jgi:hypothetical protein
MMVCLIPNSESLGPLVFLGGRGNFYWDYPHSLTNLLTHSCPPLPSMPKNLDKLKIRIQGNLQISLEWDWLLFCCVENCRWESHWN